MNASVLPLAQMSGLDVVDQPPLKCLQESLSGLREDKAMRPSLAGDLREQLHDHHKARETSCIPQADCPLARGMSEYAGTSDTAESLVQKVAPEVQLAQRSVTAGLQIRNESGHNVYSGTWGGPWSW